MSGYFIDYLEIKKLWGYQDINLSFHNDVNILIGPNACGKTTILNLLSSILFADLQSILKVTFERADIKLKSFDGKLELLISVLMTEKALEISLGQSTFAFDKKTLFGSLATPISDSEENATGLISNEFLNQLTAELTSLVPLVWLPINRRSTVGSKREQLNKRTTSLETVDLHLEELLDELFRYHSDLNSQLSHKYREFEYKVLSVILFSEEFDQLDIVKDSLTSDEKEQLIRVFRESGFFDKKIQKRIENHFASIENVLKQLQDDTSVRELKPEELVVVPLISRTKEMVKYAEELENNRNNIFEHLDRFEKIANSFLNNKSIKVDNGGKLYIQTSSSSDLNPRFLSSGEKQILILLTEALLQADSPVVYIADEPELSLHVIWQAKLLESLVELGDEMQIIVATHSPDIIGKFVDNVIRMDNKNNVN